MWLDRGSGAKCYMLLARGLHISWGDTPCYWRWMDLPDSRFAWHNQFLLYLASNSH